MHLDRRSVLRSLGAAAAVGLAVPRLPRAWPRPVANGERPARLGGFRAQGTAGGAAVTEPRRAERFSMVGITAPDAARVEVRASSDGRDFGPWLPVRSLGAEGEGPEGAEARAAGSAWKRNSTPVWTGAATWLQLRVAGAPPEDVEAALIDAPPRAGDGAAAARSSTGPRVQPALWRGGLEEPDTIVPASSGLEIVRREDWGADESIRRADPSYADRVYHGVVHHTATGNDYDPADGPAIVRSIYRYHVLSNGWNDIGYNLLVDRYGVVYEGRYGGLDRPVIGAHAAGANTGSFGVSLIGDFRWADPPEAMRWALFEVLVWKFNLHAIDPYATVTTVSGQSGVPTLAGHRDVGSTTCPGDHVHWRLKHWRDGLAERVDTSGFSDIAGHTHEQAIRDLRAAGVTNGYSDGTYRPDENVSRAQMATFITRAVPLQPGDDTSFGDVAPSHPHFDGIAAVAAAGISKGYGDGTFRPSNDVTRGQMASFLARALDLDPLDNETFDDVGRDHPHYGTIEALAAAEVTLGRGDGTYRPDHPVTRGQMASFLVRAFEIPSEDEEPEGDPDLEEDEETAEEDHTDDGTSDDGSTDEGSTEDTSDDGTDDGTDDGIDDGTDDGTTDDGSTDDTSDGELQEAVWWGRTSRARA